MVVFIMERVVSSTCDVDPRSCWMPTSQVVGSSPTCCSEIGGSRLSNNLKEALPSKSFEKMVDVEKGLGVQHFQGCDIVMGIRPDRAVIDIINQPHRGLNIEA